MAALSESEEGLEVYSDALVAAFQSMVIQDEFQVAMDLIGPICDEIAPPSLINDIIFKILMKNCDEDIANEVNVYLDNYLYLLPKKRPSIRYDYGGVLQDKSGAFANSIWSVFSHLVKSSFVHHKVSLGNETTDVSEIVKYPNCDILIKFYADMLMKFLSLEIELFEEDSANRFSLLLKWINIIYKSTDQRIDILDTLHILLDKKVEYEISPDTALKKMHNLVNCILNNGQDVFRTAKNMQGFFARSHFPLVVQARIFQYKLYNLIYKKRLNQNQHFPLTLKTIIFSYFFKDIAKKEIKPEKLENPKRVDLSSIKASNEIKKMFIKKNVTDNSELHEYCLTNKFGDLLEFLCERNSKPNERNSVGRTPLHEACLSKSYYCAKTLMEDIPEDGEKVDLKAADNYGLTALHCAAYVDSVEIARVLLKHGGAELVILKDNFGEKAIKYASSKTMVKLLKGYDSNDQAQSSEISLFDFDKDKLTVPTMKDNEEYFIFLYGLFSILSYYLESFNLYSLQHEEMDKLCHNDCKCPHYITQTKSAVCDEDAAVFMSLPENLDHFFACIQKEEIGVDVQRKLLPLKILRNKLGK